eukprot:COSAG05_NODE_1584_length_4486_cov_402.617506_4_plen_101_part_00
MTLNNAGHAAAPEGGPAFAQQLWLGDVVHQGQGDGIAVQVSLDMSKLQGLAAGESPIFDPGCPCHMHGASKRKYLRFVFVWRQVSTSRRLQFFPTTRPRR